MPMTERRLAQIKKGIAGIKAELAAIGQMRPGSLTRQYKDPERQSGAYRKPVYILCFGGACLLGSAYGFLQGAWPFGLVEAIWGSRRRATLVGQSQVLVHECNW